MLCRFAGFPLEKEMAVPMNEVISYLTKLDRMVPNHFFGTILRHGRPFAAAKRPKGVRLGRQKMCYKNATDLALSDPRFTYCEGYVLINGMFLIEHGWVTDETGAAIDPTLRHKPSEVSYFGIAFNPEYVITTALTTGVYGLLHYSNRKMLNEDPASYLHAITEMAA